MKRIYRTPRPKSKAKTKAQIRREWERTVIGGGMVRASAFPRTAFILNKGRGAVIQVIGVPLRSERQFEYLEALAAQGILGQTPEEIAIWFISEGLIREFQKRCRHCGAIRKAEE